MTRSLVTTGVARSYDGKYVEFDSGVITLALYPRAKLAAQVGVESAGTGSPRLAINADGSFMTATASTGKRASLR